MDRFGQEFVFQEFLGFGVGYKVGRREVRRLMA